MKEYGGRDLQQRRGRGRLGVGALVGYVFIVSFLSTCGLLGRYTTMLMLYQTVC